MKGTISIIVIAISVWLLVHNCSQTDSDRLTNLEKKVIESKSSKADSIFKILVKKYPLPSNSQMDKIESEVDKVILLETTKRITGDSTISETPAQSSQFDSLLHKMNAAKSKKYSDLNDEGKSYAWMYWLLRISMWVFLVGVVGTVILKFVSLYKIYLR